MPNVIEMSDVTFRWRGEDAVQFVIDRFGLPERKTVLLIGPSGSGKSTFLSLIAGIVSPERGRIAIKGTEITSLSAAARDQFRAEHIGVIFQMFNLLPYGSLIDNVLLPLSFAPKRRARAGAVRAPEAEARRLLERLGLERSIVEGRRAANLSVGQQQRVAAARALIGRPDLIIADEPTSALDRNRQLAFLDLLFGEVGEAGATLMMVSHDETLAPQFDVVMGIEEIIGTRMAAGEGAGRRNAEQA